MRIPHDIALTLVCFQQRGNPLLYLVNEQYRVAIFFQSLTQGITLLATVHAVKQRKARQSAPYTKTWRRDCVSKPQKNRSEQSVFLSSPMLLASKRSLAAILFPFWRDSWLRCPLWYGGFCSKTLLKSLISALTVASGNASNKSGTQKSSCWPLWHINRECTRFFGLTSYITLPSLCSYCRCRFSDNLTTNCVSFILNLYDACRNKENRHLPGISQAFKFGGLCRKQVGFFLYDLVVLSQWTACNLE